MAGKKGTSVETSANKDKSAEVNASKNAGNSGPRGIGSGRKLTNGVSNHKNEETANQQYSWIEDLAPFGVVPLVKWGSKGIKNIDWKSDSLKHKAAKVLINSLYAGLGAMAYPRYKEADLEHDTGINYQDMIKADQAYRHVANFKPEQVKREDIEAQAGLPWWRFASFGNDDGAALSWVNKVRPDTYAYSQYWPAIHNLSAPGLLQGTESNISLKSIYGPSGTGDRTVQDANVVADAMIGLGQLHQREEYKDLIDTLMSGGYLSSAQRDNVATGLRNLVRRENMPTSGSTEASKVSPVERKTIDYGSLFPNN